MKGTSVTGEDAGLQFFGSVTASISHEIKNVLAIINENAGLLEDLALMAEKGRPLEIERVKTLAGKVKDQVRRGDEIIKNMNRFAHSVDSFVERVDLDEVLSLVIKLAHRPASMKGVRLEARVSTNRILITTIPFLLINLIWLCLSRAMEGTQGPSTACFALETVENGARIRITGLPGISRLQQDDFFNQRRDALLNALQGDMTLDPESGELVIGLSREITGG